MYDSLTGLPNRALFLDRLRLALARLQRWPDRLFAVLFIDVGEFDTVNEGLGEDAGDALLLEMTRKLHECVRPQDTVARFGGDAFAVLLDEVARREDVALVAERIQVAAQRPMVLEGQPVVVSASIGVVIVTQQYQRAEDVMRAADHAMDMAKMNGHGEHVFAP